MLLWYRHCLKKTKIILKEKIDYIKMVFLLFISLILYCNINYISNVKEKKQVNSDEILIVKLTTVHWLNTVAQVEL